MHDKLVFYKCSLWKLKFQPANARFCARWMTDGLKTRVNIFKLLLGCQKSKHISSLFLSYFFKELSKSYLLRDYFFNQKYFFLSWHCLLYWKINHCRKSFKFFIILHLAIAVRMTLRFIGSLAPKRVFLIILLGHKIFIHDFMEKNS